MRYLPLLTLLLVAACGGDDDTDPPVTQCEEGCRQVVLIPCRNACDQDCGTDDVCRDTCHGDCLGRFDSCVAEECTE